jgi:HipA-like protein
MFSKINKQIKKWFGKGDEDIATHLPKEEKATFILTVDDFKMGILHCENGIWEFKYTDEFKKRSKEYTLIVGFPDIDKTYRSETLWPFFRIRIPGLKQASVQEVIKKEQIDQENEAALLKRFGRKTISNPYELVLE